jgi:hypothetical protein
VASVSVISAAWRKAQTGCTLFHLLHLFFVIVFNMETNSPVMSVQHMFQYVHQPLPTYLFYHVPQMIFTFLHPYFTLAVKLSFEQNIIGARGGAVG